MIIQMLRRGSNAAEHRYSWCELHSSTEAHWSTTKSAGMWIPQDHGFGSRRVPLESGYCEAYNRDNVLLVDTMHDGPIERITPNGIKTSKKEYQFDFLI